MAHMFTKSFLIFSLVIFHAHFINKSISHPNAFSWNMSTKGNHAQYSQNNYEKGLQEITTGYAIPNSYLYFNNQNTKLNDLGDGTVVAYGEKFHLVNIPIMGTNRLVPLSFQYALRIPSSAINKEYSIQNGGKRNDTTYSQETDLNKQDIIPPLPPNMDSMPGTIDFLPLIDSRLIQRLQDNQGNSFDTKPPLGQVPVVRPGHVRPFALFWYLPVNPQIEINTKKVVKNDQRFHSALTTSYYNPVFGSNPHFAAKPYHQPPVFMPIAHAPYVASRNRYYVSNILK